MIAEKMRVNKRLGVGLSKDELTVKSLATAEAAEKYGVFERRLTSAGFIDRCVATAIHVAKTPKGDPPSQKGGWGKGHEEESGSMCEKTSVLVFQEDVGVSLSKRDGRNATDAVFRYYRSRWTKVVVADGSGHAIRAMVQDAQSENFFLEVGMG